VPGKRLNLGAHMVLLLNCFPVTNHPVLRSESTIEIDEIQRKARDRDLEASRGNDKTFASPATNRTRRSRQLSWAEAR
jgi:hypothetical protein